MIFVIWGIIFVLGIWIISIYNGLTSLRWRIQNAWRQIDVQLKRRYDLIPNLIETVKGYMQYEQDTLQKVIEARSQAMLSKGAKEAAADEMAVNIRAALLGSSRIVCRHMPPAPGAHLSPEPWPRSPASSCHDLPPSFERKRAASSTPA